MKKIKKVVILFILVLGMCFCYPSVKADSGWDSDYDSGSSWDSGWDSDYDSGWDSDYSSGSYYGSSGSGDLGSAFVIAVIIMIVVIIIISNNKNNRGNGGSSTTGGNIGNNYNDISQDEINKIDSSINREEFKKRAFDIYKEIQLAWMNFDKGKIRKLTTNEIYNMYSAQLDALKVKNQRNIMAEIEYRDAKVISIKKENDIITILVYLDVSCYDYVVKEGTNDAIRGDKNHKMNIQYVLTFVKSANSDNDNITICPNCGAEVEMTASGKCKYCDAVLVQDASDFVMSKKQSVGQRMMR